MGEVAGEGLFQLTQPNLERQRLATGELNPRAPNPLVMEVGIEGHKRRSLSSTGKVLADLQGPLLNHPYLRRYKKELNLDDMTIWQKFVQRVQDIQLPKEYSVIYGTEPNLKGDQLLDQLAMDFVAASRGETARDFKIWSGLRLNPGAKPGTLSDEINKYLAAARDNNIPLTAQEIARNIKGLRMIGTDPKVEISEDYVFKAVQAYIDQSVDTTLTTDPKTDAGFRNRVFAEIPEVNRDMSNVVVIVTPGLGRFTDSKNVVATVEALKAAGIQAISLNWPPFSGDLASFQAQAKWFGEIWWKMNEKMLEGKEIIHYGFSRGDLTGREIMNLFPDRIKAYLGACGPARTMDELDGHTPVELETAVEAMQRGGKKASLVEKSANWIITKFGKYFPDEFIQFLLTDPRQACTVYNSHIKNEPRWRRLAKEALPIIPALFYYGNGDKALDMVGHRSYLEQNQVTVLRHPTMGHGMVPTEYLPRIIKYLMFEADKRAIQYDPQRLESLYSPT